MNSALRAGLHLFRPLAARSPKAPLLAVAMLLVSSPLAAQGGASGGAQGPANYRLAARFAPYKIQDLIYSTSVDPQWIEGSESFWYEWESSEGSSYYIVDPVAGTKRQIFDNDRIAAELTRITRDPWDGRHLPIRGIKFIDASTLQFEVESSQDEEEEADSGVEEIDEDELDEEEEEGERQRRRARKKVFHFEYDVNTRALRGLGVAGQPRAVGERVARRADGDLRPPS